MSKTNAAGRKGPKVKVIILLIVLAIVIGFVAMMIYSASMMSGMTMAEVTELQKKNIENTISVSGIVESRTFEKVSANLQYNVETVNVEVGDKVKKGDILATLNSDDLQNQIIQQQASIDSSNINTEYSLTTAEKNYNEALQQINDGTYPEIRNAKMNLDSAEDALKKAQDKYDEQLAVSGTDRDSQLTSAKNSVASAKAELDYAYDDYTEAKSDVENEDYSDIKNLKDAYDDAKKEYDSRYSTDKNDELTKAREAYQTAYENYSYLSTMLQFESGSVTQNDVAQAQQVLNEAQTKLSELEAKYNVKTTEKTYESALEAYTKAKADIDSSNSVKLKNAERAYERAKTSYETAKSNLASVEDGNDTSLKSYKDAVDSAQQAVEDAKESYSIAQKNAESSLASLKAAADREKVLSENDVNLINLEILKDKLADCVITAPCDGTITEVNAVSGSAAAGVLFIIEDLDDLKMTASVKEYSISEMKTGLDVKVTIPSLNNKEFDGTVTKIAPTGNKGVDGKSDGTSSFGVEIAIHDTKDSGVLIGMTSKCTAVTGSAENVYAVGYDSLIEDADGNCYIYAADMVDATTATARKIPVTTGFENDAEIEIISDELTDGMTIITNAGDVTDGGVVIIASALGDAVQSAAAAQ